MKDKLEHLHSDSAYEMLEEYMIGRLGTDANIVSEGQELVSSTHDLYLHRSPDWVATEDFHPEDTNTSVDYEKCQFLDLRKPLLSQVWYSNFRYVVSLLFVFGQLTSHYSKNFYLRQVHQPRHLAQSARLFGPDFLEVSLLTSDLRFP